ncbi:unnamed protein product, partial [Prorocentrum cordatum]
WSLSVAFGGWGLLPLAFLFGRLCAGRGQPERRSGAPLATVESGPPAGSQRAAALPAAAPPGRAMARAADIHEMMVAINFEDVPNSHWHVSNLEHRLDDLRWIALSLDLEVVVLDLSRHIGAARQGAAALADVLRPAGAAAPAGQPGGQALITGRRFADPAHEHSGEVALVEIIRNAFCMAIRGGAGLAEGGDDGERRCTFAERPAAQDLEDWRAEKSSGCGRDARTLPIQRDMGRARIAPLKGAIAEMTFLTDPPPAGWPFAGPQAIQDALAAARAANEDLPGFHERWARSSGVNPDRAVALKHRDFFSVLHHL